MAPGSHPCQSFQQNALPPINLVDNKLAGVLPRAPTKTSMSPAPIFQAFSCVSTSRPALFIVISALKTFVGNYINKDLQRAIKFALELFI